MTAVRTVIGVKTNETDEKKRLDSAEQTVFNPADQLGNIDRLSERSMPFDAEPSLCLGSCD